MADNSQRRYGSDFENLRNLPADGGRSPRGEDPLAELARLVAQGERQGYGSSNAKEAASFAPDEFDVPVNPRGGFSDTARGGYADHHEPRAYGATGTPDYDPEPDFFPQAANRIGQPEADEFEFPAVEQDYYARLDYDEDAADPAGIYPAMDEDDRHDETRRRSGGLLTVLAVLVIAVLGGFSAWAYGMFGGAADSGDNPPVIQAETEPAKVVPEATANNTAQPQNKLIYDRVSPIGDGNVVGGAEEPAERPVAEPPRDVTNQINPDTSSEALALAPGSRPDPSQSGARMVRTIAIRPDGTMGPSTPELPPAENVAAELPQPAGPPQPIVGTGPVAEGMSMEQGPEFGIMASENSSGSAPAQGSVPMPQSRPDSLGNRMAAADPVEQTPVELAPAPAPVAQPRQSPNVNYTQSRALRPQSAPVGTPPPPAQRAVPQTQRAAPPPQRTAAIQAQPAASSVQRAAAPQAARPAAGGGFSVQVTSQRSEGEARAAFTTLQQRYPSILGGYQPSLQPINLPDRGTFYRVRVNAGSQTDASNLCASLKAAGGDCIVQRN